MARTRTTARVDDEHSRHEASQRRGLREPDFRREEHADGGAPPRKPLGLVTVPLVLLAIRRWWRDSALVESMLVGRLLSGSSIVVAVRPPCCDVEASRPDDVAHSHPARFGSSHRRMLQPPFWLALAASVSAWYLLPRQPGAPGAGQARAAGSIPLLDNKYYFDCALNDWFLRRRRSRSRQVAVGSVLRSRTIERLR